MSRDPRDVTKGGSGSAQCWNTSLYIPKSFSFSLHNMSTEHTQIKGLAKNQGLLEYRKTMAK